MRYLIGGVALAACVIALLLYFSTDPMTLPPLPTPSGDYDFSESVDASIARYTAMLTNARRESADQPPKSMLTITDGATGVVLGSWTLGAKEFWTNDPESGVIGNGNFDVNKRCYTHDVWTGDYSPGTPLVHKEAREFCF